MVLSCWCDIFINQLASLLHLSYRIYCASSDKTRAILCTKASVGHKISDFDEHAASLLSKESFESNLSGAHPHTLKVSADQCIRLNRDLGFFSSQVCGSELVHSFPHSVPSIVNVWLMNRQGGHLHPTKLPSIPEALHTGLRRGVSVKVKKFYSASPIVSKSTQFGTVITPHP
uniref:AlNc14C53G4087 protein n=1 Tax=Albugo laibachii Nc14 TaxID=890382 RepID=F0WBP6_9STRA|nr:AlNc14C53G4087 [Albugo laibachii Nc14]|eukprot:CCA18573.1 AlNc14C53G4087 [Albugo laibachii Nc14]